MDRTAALTEILAQDPANVMARYSLAMEYARQHKNAQARVEFERLMAEQPDYVPGFQMAGQFLLKAGENDRARDVLSRGMAAAKRAGNAHAASEILGLLDELAD